MKIALTGAHCTGKTTLLNIFPERYPQNKYFLIDEKARDIIKRGFPLTKDGNQEAYTVWINEKLNSEIRACVEEYDVLISDRSLIDIISYVNVAKLLPRPYISDGFIEMCENMFFFQKNFYDMYVYLPIEFRMEVDDVRPNDEEYRENIGKMIKYFLDKYSINYVTISGNIDERCEQLDQIIPKRNF